MKESGLNYKDISINMPVTLTRSLPHLEAILTEKTLTFYKFLKGFFHSINLFPL